MPRRRHRSNAAVSGYWDRSQRPLQSLIFLAPLLIAYELGLIFIVRWNHRAIMAEEHLQQFFRLFDVTSYYLPGLLVVIVLLAWHFVRKDPWHFEPPLYGVMAAESIVLVIPLFVFGLVINRDPTAVSAMLAQTPVYDWQAKLVFSIGAGIYEELLFRLIAIALLHMILVDVLALPHHIGAIGAVGGSAILFAVYHFSESNPFTVSLMFYYSVAGVYFAGIYVLRGFGIVAATHAIYDIFIVMMEVLHA